MIETHLSEIGRVTGTDKYSLHRFTDYYHELLSELRHRHINMLEIGVLGGNSLAMWDAFFDHPKTKIWGVDIHTRWVPDPGSRMQFREGSGADPMFIAKLMNETGILDLVIDDGSHFSSEQKESLKLLWPYVAPGGLYICEDTHTSYTDRWTPSGETSFVEHMMGWIHDLNENGKDHCGIPTDSTIDSITFRKSLVILRKR